MTERSGIGLVSHHWRISIPALIQELGDRTLNEQYIFFRYGIVSEDYAFLWDKTKVRRFTSGLIEAVEAYQTGSYIKLDESRKSEDRICQACDNFQGRRCKFENCNLD